MPMFVDVSMVGIYDLNRRMGKLPSILEKPDHSYSIRAMAKVWERNFSSEGAAVGGWKELRPYTQEVREQRGYDPEHPILVQSGALRRTVITSLVNGRGPRSVAANGIAMTSVYHGLRATMNATGAKAENQRGSKGTIGPRSKIPPRPFWFVNPEVNSEATKGLQRWVTKILGDYR